VRGKNDLLLKFPPFLKGDTGDYLPILSPLEGEIRVRGKNDLLLKFPPFLKGA